MSGPEPTRATVADGGRAVVLTWSDGLREALPAVWLCDSAEDAFDEQTGQRRRGLGALDPEARIARCALEPAGLAVSLAGGRDLRVVRRRLRDRRRERPSPTLWLTAASIEAPDPLSADACLNDDEALAETASRVARQGLAILSGGLAEPGYVERIVARFGFIRETNYGRLFDVRSESRPSNLAYTAEALDLHTDNPYRDPPPSLQLLHAIRADTHGGATCFADGFAHARAMEATAPEAFERLARHPVEFAYAAPDGAVYRARRPLIELGPDGAILAVRLNHRSLAPPDLPADELTAWYRAYSVFHQSLHAPGAALRIRLQPGDVALFDNRRIAHGREAYDGLASAGRWLQGCYADIDGLLATLARLRPESAP
ncbi:MAG TPA: TauD/TfdA family dioxygenase [Phenylobacterium sp.]|jgi:alpha-ketoglutarate-dependent taurine dioxygenase|uniref:TauD/TfdA family dioxygenase n=1 Tax=Phenylobacterium sp. TaxID=1871053 RepID=UPI002C821EE7|nr:TauD/TfdA family dioxygenase [Phenylobacterium sp.]HXA39459.1 TauD/TfdA family dioxygenase [Phenylobacterium sp.]